RQLIDMTLLPLFPLATFLIAHRLGGDRLRAGLTRRPLLARLLRLAPGSRSKAGLGAETGKAIDIRFKAFALAHLGLDARLLLRRLVLPELLLCGGNQAKIVFCMLIVVFCRDRVAGAARITRQLKVFFSNMRRVATDLDIR